jgi:hypothetical protein
MPRVKDVCELHLLDPERFEERIELAMKRAVFWSDTAESEACARSRTAWAACEELALAPNILDRFETDLRLCGVVGESRVAKILYLTVTSRFLPRIVSVVIKRDPPPAARATWSSGSWVSSPRAPTMRSPP